ncbi:MAG: protein kinase [Polyangia bacterium]
MADKGDSSWFTFADREMPVRFGRYHLLERTAVDPVGEEFLAAWGVEEGVEQLRTLKCIYPRIAEEEEFIALFSEEARALSRLSSANVVRVMEVGVEGAVPFVAREHVEGLPVARLLELAESRGSPWPWELAAHVTAEVLRGLDYVHRREDIHGQPMGMRHGDVRPANVIVSFDGEIKLTNFGTTLRFIADEKTNARLRDLRRRFEPPEGRDGLEPTVGGDLWGAAMTLLAMLIGRAPRRSPAEEGASWSPPRMASRVESLPPVVDTFLGRALNPGESYRFDDAASMRAALLEIMGSHAVGHPPDDLAAWAGDLGRESREREREQIRRRLGCEAVLEVEGTDGASALAPGNVLDGRYHLLRQIGEGGMGVVFEAEHTGLGRRLALKVLHERVLDDDSAVERFRREARIVGGLGHPAIVGASDFGVTEEGYHFLAMELLEGESLAGRIASGSIAPAELTRALAEVCDGLQAAHEAGVIHRDLKPDNIYLTPRGARILDFGIAKRTGLEAEDRALTRTGHICGTVDYIAPEQIRGLDEDPRSDIYGVGVILYEALTGETPFHGRTVGETLHRVINDKLVSPRKRTGDKTIPAELEAICTKALSRHPEKRFQSAEELAAALRALLPSAGAGAVSPRRRGRKLALAAGGGGAAALIAAVAGWLALADRGSGSFEESVVAIGPAAADAGMPPVEPEDEPVVVELTEDAVARDGGAAGQETEAPVKTAGAEGRLAERPGKREEAQTLELITERITEGNAALRSMRLDRASELFVEALRLDAGSAAARFGLGRVAFEQGRYDAALVEIRRALRLRPGRPRYRNFLGQIQLTRGERERAVEQWKAVLRLHPENEEARRLLEAAGVSP